MQAVKIMDHKIDTSDWTLEEKISQAAQMRQKGSKLQEIADQFEVDKGTVSRWLNKFDDLAQQMEQVAKEKEEALEFAAKAEKRLEDFQEGFQRVASEREAAIQQVDVVVQEKSKLVQQLEKLHTDIATLESRLTTTNNDNATLVQQLEKLQREQSGGVQQISVVAQEKTALVQQLEKLQAEYATLQNAFTLTDETNKNLYKELEFANEDIARHKANTDVLTAKIEANRRTWLLNIFKSNTFTALVLLTICTGVAWEVSSKILEHVNVAWGWAKAIAIGIDMAAFIFILQGELKTGKWFAVATAIQVAIVTGSLHWILNPLDVEILVKSITMATASGMALHGFSVLIYNAQNK